MPRTIVDTPLSTRTARERLAARHAPYWRGIDAGAAVGYRKGATAAVWLARVVDPSAGSGYRQIKLGRADDTLKADGVAVLDFRGAEAKAREWIARRNRIAAGLEPEQEASPTKPYSVTEAMADYLADYQARGGKSARQTRNTIEAHVLPTLGALAVASLTRDKLKSWHRGLAAAPARVRAPKGALAQRATSNDPDAARRRRSTANRVLTVLRAALNHARTEGRVSCSADAWAAVKAFREADQPRIHYLSDAESLRLLEACPADLRTMVGGALATGCRYGELAQMRASDFDAAAGTVMVAISKGGKARHVVLTVEGGVFFALQAAGKAPTDPMFDRVETVAQASKNAPAVTRRGRWGHNHQYRAMREACAAAGIAPAATFHVLRHTYASRLANKGAPMSVIATQLGHADLRMTTRHYAHLAPSFVAQTVRAMLGDLGLALPADGRPNRQVF